MRQLGERLLRRLGPHYILVMMFLTRISGSVGGLLVIYYVELMLTLPRQIRHDFRVISIVVVTVACTLTVLLALWESRHLRVVLALLRAGQPVSPELAREAGREAVIFAGRHHRHESWLVPCSTLLPLLVLLRVFDDASTSILLNITLAAFMGTTMALMSTFFAVEHGMQPVIRYLLDQGLAIDYSTLPSSQLRVRFRVCSTLILMTAALMIGTLAWQRATDIIADPVHQAEAVDNLRTHCIYITVAAVIIGVFYSGLLANSVTRRVAELVSATDHVALGDLSHRVRPTGNDEIDLLAREFNMMLSRLEQNNHTIRDLNANLEQKVVERTEALQKALQQLQETQSQLTDLAHRAGMAEVATGVLHNVGNVLNSVNISTAMIADRVRKSKLMEFRRFVDQLGQQRNDLIGFLSTQGRADKLLDYLDKLAGHFDTERDDLLKEIHFLTEKVGHIKAIITSQQNYARRVSFQEEVDLNALVQEILALHRESFSRYDINVRLELDEATPPAHLEKAKLLQVVANLVKNAVDSLKEWDGPLRELTVRTESSGPGRVRIVVADTGRGIRPEHLKMIFTYGFTTKKTGNGFGLHSSALAMTALGGSIRAASDGEGQGAEFIVEFPLSGESTDAPAEFPSAETAAIATDATPAG